MSRACANTPCPATVAPRAPWGVCRACLRVTWKPGRRRSSCGTLATQTARTRAHSATVYHDPRGTPCWVARVDAQHEGAIATGPTSEHRSEMLAKKAAAKRLRAAVFA